MNQRDPATRPPPPVRQTDPDATAEQVAAALLHRDTQAAEIPPA